MADAFSELTATLAVSAVGALDGAYHVNSSGVQPDGYVHGELEGTYTASPLGVVDLQGSVAVYRTSSLQGQVAIGAAGSLTGAYEVLPRPEIVDVLRPTGDTFVWAARPTMNFEGRQDLDTGLHPDGELRTLLRFGDLPTAPHPVEIKSARLRVWVRATTSGQPAVLSMRPVLADWQSDQATWLNQPVVDAVMATVQAPPGEGWVEFDLTALFDQWWNGGQANYGVRIDADQVRILDASEGPHPPELVVTWSPHPESAFTPGISDLPSDTTVPGRQLPGEAAVRQAASDDVASELAVRVSGRADLSASIEAVANALGAEAGVSRPDMPGAVSIVFSTDLQAAVGISRPDLPGQVQLAHMADLPAEATVRQAADSAIDGTATVRQQAATDLLASVRAVYPASAGLPGAIGVRREALDELPASAGLSRPGLPAQVQLRIVADLPAAAAVRRKAYAQLEGDVGVNDRDLEGSALIVIAGESKIPGTATIVKHRAADLPSDVGVRVEAATDLPAWASVVLGPNDLPITAQVLSGYLRAEAFVAERSEIWLVASIRQINVSEIPIVGVVPGPHADLEASVFVWQPDHDRLPGYVFVPWRSNLPGSVAARVRRSADLPASLRVSDRSDTPIYGNIRQIDLDDLAGAVIVSKPAVPVEVAISRPNLDGALVIRQSDAADLPALVGINLRELLGSIGVSRWWIDGQVVVSRAPVTDSIPGAVAVRSWAEYTDELYWSLAQPNRAEHPASGRRVIGRA